MKILSYDIVQIDGLHIPIVVKLVPNEVARSCRGVQLNAPTTP